MQFRPCDRLRESTIILSVTVLLALAGCSSVPLSSPSTSPSPGTPQSTPSKAGSKHPVLPPAGSGRGGYYLDDGPGDVTPDGLQDVPDAEPRIEPYSRTGNKPYVVFGKRYVPITDAKPFTQRGYGSWYGKKFHGQRTSSGEPYDMYQMTAAHPTLPIPSYARVTNLSNGKQVIVRVNDRGPFHSSRIIDLSYTAALRLGYIGKGSTELQVDRLLPADIEQILAAKENGAKVATVEPEAAGVVMPAMETTSLAPPAIQAASSTSAPSMQPTATTAATAPAAGFYLQFGAYSQSANAEALRARLSQNAGNVLPSLTVESSNNLYRLYSGPFATRGEAASAAMQVEQNAGGIKPFIVQR
ncbi:MAG TPA: septal ring lytic transglycosylase RlpA family protein [Oxalicibacterium sp.]|uniref:septal ring lytic transglycosylase RlpA family protein n=1 Tax=Oxalicibacterium sp. TaxID=2766525 RepID=UPI002B8FF045|nr:septal ring lytic transglycosylase RlpA family protein [Oxalicibacterium sp.]HWU97189.1 septal ring lytic transglycosylase RlpA family protein [Oxalicibacterium sp.]